MRVFRFPKSNPENNTLTDKKKLNELDINLYEDKHITFDITIDKQGEKHSFISLSFEKEDLKFFHEQYLEYLNKEVEILQKKKSELNSEITFNQKCWQSIIAASSELKYKKISPPEFIKHCEDLAGKLSIRWFDEVPNDKIKTHEIEFKDLLDEPDKLDVEKALNYILILYKNFPGDFQMYIFDRHYSLEFNTTIGEFEKILHKEVPLRNILDHSNYLDDEITPLILYNLIIDFIIKTS